MKEEWKNIKGYEGYYEVSNRGRVRSVERVVGGKTYKRKIRSLYLSANGYLYVSLCRDMTSKRLPVHRLVANAFIQNPESKKEVDHINTIRSDNRVVNLRWASRKENMNNAITKRRTYIETHKKESIEKAQNTRILRGRKTARKQVYQYTISGELLHVFPSVSEASKNTGLRTIDIAAVCRGGRGRKSCGGYMWSYTSHVEEYKPYSSKCKRLAQCDSNGDIIKIWDSLSDAINNLGISNISRATKDNSKVPIAGGFRWKYL